MAAPSLPDRVGQWYYTYGLFCSSHPRPAIVFSMACILLCCYPLLNIPLPGSIPSKIIISKHNNISAQYNDTTHFKVHINGADNISKQHSEEDVVSKIISSDTVLELMNETTSLPYLWAKDEPLMYVQQVIIKSGVLPWTDNLNLSDAFRAPIQEAFRLVEIIRNFEHPETGVTLSNICYHVESVKKNFGNSQRSPPMLPEYNCLLLSPANFWQQNLNRFKTDTNILSTVYNYQNLHKSKVSIADILLGIRLKDSGIKRYPLRTRPRIIQYAITMFFTQLDEKYLSALNERLQSVYPLHQTSNVPLSEITLVYHPGEFNYRELVPLSVSFVVLFFYVYFSVKKIELVKSKIGLAVCAVLTVSGSLSMSVGICYFFGLTLNLQGKEIFPYLVILVGLENVLVLTKSVMSTDTILDVKIRLAQGLSKEGWSITKNLLTEITILTFSLFTFVPVIQEFSIFMIVSLIADYFLQMIFFATILGIDVRRMEMSRDKTSHFQLKDFFNSTFRSNNKNDFLGFQNAIKQSATEDGSTSPKKMWRSKSHPKLNGLLQSPTDVVGGHYQNCSPGTPGKLEKKVPKRIRLVNIWARTRFFQRAFMILMVVWISMISYNSTIIRDLFVMKNSTLDHDITHDKDSKLNDGKLHNVDSLSLNNIDVMDRQEDQFNSEMKWNHKITLDTSQHIPMSNLTEHYAFNKTDYYSALKYSHHYQSWKRLSNFHWSTILSQYNVSVAGRFVAVLPPILLSCRINPDIAIAARNPEEKGPKPVQWHALAAALDPLDISDMEIENWHLGSLHQHYWSKITSSNDPFYPTTPMEILLLTILCGISVLVIAYTMVVIYRCVCSRNYAEWRASWTDGQSFISQSKNHPKQSIQFVMEAVPIVVAGHTSEVECLVSDGDCIISSCLQGELKVWNSLNGELMTNIDRRGFFGLKDLNYSHKQRVKSECLQTEADSPSEDIGSYHFGFESHEINARRKSLLYHISSAMDNIKTENLDAANNEDLFSRISALENTSYDFARQYRQIYIDSENTKELKNQFDGSIHDTPNEGKETNSKVCELCESNKTNCKHLLNQIISTANINSELAAESLYFGDKADATGDVYVKSVISARCSFDAGEVIKDEPSSPYSESSTRTNASELPRPSLSGSCAPPIWSMDFADNLIVVGCADGRLEFWEATTGNLKCWIEEEQQGSGVTHVHMVGGAARVFAARLGGHLELLRVDVYNAGRGTSVDWSFTAAYKRTHIRTGSAGSIPASALDSWKLYKDMDWQNAAQHSMRDDVADNVRCVRVAVTRAHQQPITILECGGGKVVTGSQDHTLKVFACVDLSPMYTLHGHCGPITSCFIDHTSDIIGGSGSQDGLLCVWDLVTGACLYSVQAHDGAITSLAYSASYVMSAGIDEQLCIFDRFQGHLLNTLYIGMSYACNILPLTHSLLLIGGKNSFSVWDVTYGQKVRKVVLGQNDGFVFVKQIIPLKDAVVCDYANQLRIVRFPLISKMFESRMKTE